MDETYDQNSSTDAGLDPQLMVYIFTFVAFIMVISMVARWRIFTKAGQPGWAALIPVYNLYITAKIVGKRGWYLLWFLVPIANIVAAVKLTHYLSRSFDKDVGFTLGLIFLSPIFYSILAFSDAEYLGPYADREGFAAYQEQNKFEFEEVA